MINFKKMNERNNKIKKNFWQIFYAILAALVIRSFLYEPFSIPSGSMYPNLKVGDYLFVSKFSYGFSRNSLPFSIPLIPGRIFYKEPKRGDIVVFKTPEDNRTDYIKRLIGLPGDKISMQSNQIFLNGNKIQSEFINNENYKSFDVQKIKETLVFLTINIIKKTLIIGKIKMDRNTLSKIQNYLRFTLGSKQLKVEGRENKIDSADVTLNGEFLGVIFEDKEDGDICYHFNMTILDIDLKE